MKTKSFTAVLALFLLAGCASPYLPLAKMGTKTPASTGGGGSSGPVYTRLTGAAAGTVTGYDVAVDASGNLYAGGSTNKGLDGQTLIGTGDGFLKKYDSDLNALWTVHLGVAAKYTFISAVAVDASGNIYVAGQTNAALPSPTANSYPSTSPNIDHFVARYNAAGVLQWTTQFGSATYGASASSYYNYAVDLTTDASGNVYVAGRVYGSILLTKNSSGASITPKTYTGGPAAYTGVSFDNYFARLSPTGDVEWVNEEGGNGAEIKGIAVDSADGVLYALYQAPSTATVAGQATTGGQFNAVLVKYPVTGGASTWARRFGDPLLGMYADRVGVDGSHRVYTSGIIIAGSLDGNNNSNPATNDYDLVLSQWTSAGVRTWTQQAGAVNSGQVTMRSGADLAVSSSGTIALAGFTKDVWGGAAKGYVCTYDGNGTRLAERSLGLAASFATQTLFQGAAFLPDGTAVAVGYTGDATLDGQTKAGTQDAVVTKLAAAVATTVNQPANPVPDQTPGPYTGSVALSHPAGATIRYTTDGSDPATSGTAVTYSSAINVLAPTNLRTVATLAGVSSQGASYGYYPSTYPLYPGVSSGAAALWNGGTATALSATAGTRAFFAGYDEDAPTAFGLGTDPGDTYGQFWTPNPTDTNNGTLTSTVTGGWELPGQSNVKAVGFYHNGSNTMPHYWVFYAFTPTGAATVDDIRDLPVPAGDDGWATGAAYNSTTAKVYVSGATKNTGTGLYTACVWLSTNTTGPRITLGDGTNDSFATAVAYDNNKVYVAGMAKASGVKQPVYWTIDLANGNAVTKTVIYAAEGEVYDVKVSNGQVYTAGYWKSGANRYAMVWKGTSGIFTGVAAASTAFSRLYVFGQLVLAGGITGSNILTLGPSGSATGAAGSIDSWFSSLGGVWP